MVVTPYHLYNKYYIGVRVDRASLKCPYIDKLQLPPTAGWHVAYCLHVEGFTNRNPIECITVVVEFLWEKHHGNKL